ncbi:MAG: ABC transporter permease [Candidatus Omnitrophota bacterium]|nr:ABC transporter permease [Candidatus Omnitrophota bacterium]
MRTIRAIAGSMIRELLRKKDFYVLFIFILVLLGLLSSQTFFDLEGVSRYVKDLGYSLLMLFSFIIAVTFTAKQLPSEIEARTIYPLLAKPVSRHMFILGKYFGGLVVSVITFTLFFAVYAAFYLAGGEEGSPMLLVQGYIFGVFFLCLVVALVLFFSNFLTLSANVTLSFILYMIINGFSDSFRDLALFSKGAASVLYGAIYYLLPHFDFFDLRVRLTHAWDPLATWVIAAVAVYTFVYCSILLYFAGILFGRKRL